MAKELGISPSTVSRALNNSPKISETRRREIKKVARKHGFKLRDFAPRLTNLCVLICADPQGENVFCHYTDQVNTGVIRYCNANDLEFSIFSSTINKLNKINVVKELFRRSADGVVILNATSKCDFIEQVEEEGLPYCCLLSGNSRFPARILGVDNKSAAEKATSHLIQLGHRNIEFLYSASNNQVHLERLAGYQAALQAAGIPLEGHQVGDLPAQTSPSSIAHGFKATTHMLETRPDITAIFAAGYDLAVGARSALHARGLSIPRDISLIGCDDSPEAEHFCPPLTVLDIPNARLGECAAIWVHQQMEGNGASRCPNEPWMSGRLIVRETTAPPRATQGMRT